MRSRLNKVLKGAAILFTGSMIASLLGIIVISLITKNIPLELYGVIVMMQAYVMLVDQLFNFQSWQALIKYGTIALENNESGDLKKYIQLSISLDVFGSVLAFCFSLVLLLPLAFLFSLDLELLDPYIFYGVILLFRILGTPTALLRLTEQYKYFNYQLLLNWGSKLFFIVILILFEILNIYNIFVVFIMGEVLSSIYLIIYGIKALKQYNLTFKEVMPSLKVFSIDEKYKRFLLFSFRSNLYSAIHGITHTIDELIVGSILGPASAGIFKIMKLLASIISRILDPLYVASYPEFSKLVSQNKYETILYIIKRVSALNLFISFLVIIVFYFFGEFIILNLFTSEYLIGLPMIKFYLWGVLFAFVFYYVQPLMLSLEIEKIGLYIHFFASSIYILLLYSLANEFGLWSIVISSLFYVLLTTIPKFYFIQKKTNLFFNLKK